MNDWIDNKESFEVIDVRKAQGVFLPGLMKKVNKLNVGEGICIIQTFEPKPLYSALEEMGFEYKTVKISDIKYKVYASRVKMGEIKYEGGIDMPFKPTAILNYKKIDNELAGITVDFWELIWDKKDAAIDLKTKLMLSLSNAVGAGRFRQATRELIKAYSLGLSTAEMDELFELFAWNQGIGNFSSEIGPSPLFKVYTFIKKEEKKNIEKSEIMKELMEKFGDKNPRVNV